MKIGEVLNSTKPKIKAKSPNLKPRDAICQKQPINEQISKLFAIKTQRKEKAERKGNSIPAILKVMEKKELDSKQMKNADLKPDVEMFKIAGVDEKEYMDFMRDINYYAMTLKMKYMRPRPYQISDKISTTKTKTDDTPAFPSGHSMLAHGLERVLGKKFPEKKKELKAMADKISLSRMQMGSHYPSDIQAGKKIGYMLGDAYE